MEIKQHTFGQQLGSKKIKRKIRKYLKASENKNIAHQNLLVLREKFIAIKKEESFQVT